MLQIFDPKSWKVIHPGEVVKILEFEKIFEKKNTKTVVWQNSPQRLSPLTLYKFLKSKFGPPNGFVMALKNPTSDNLIHWNYTFVTKGTMINIWGKSSGLEITYKIPKEFLFEESYWDLLIENIQKEYSEYGKEMKEVQTKFEQWALFINPFARIEHTLQRQLDQLEKVDINEIGDYKIRSGKEALDIYTKKLEKWIKNIEKAAILGTTIRMLCPVLGEAFINLIILVFRKNEFKTDERLYQNLIRQEIDIRVKTLHINCSCFDIPIDTNATAYKNFHTLMNGRNDFLHGNVDPNRLIVENVWFDHKTIPLFEKDEGMIKKMLRNYCTNVERDKAVSDFQKVSNFIELVLNSMDDISLYQFVQILGDRMPGINKITGRLGVLFPSSHLVQDFVSE